MAKSIKTWQINSHLYGGNMAFVEALYERYLNNPKSIEEGWRQYFDSMSQTPGFGTQDINHSHIIAAFSHRKKHSIAKPSETKPKNVKQVSVLQLINSFRFLGNRIALTDPLQRHPQTEVPELTIAHHNLTTNDLGEVFETGSLAIGKTQAQLGEIFTALKKIYCNHIGYEYMHLTALAEKRWLQGRIEPLKNIFQYEAADQLRLLQRLTCAETLERYLHRRFVGQKRFSLEGSESLIVALDELVRSTGRHKGKEVVIGMAHRGRLNVLVNTLGKSPQDLFDEFEGRKNAVEEEYDGDVKYHLGYSSDVATPGGPVHLTLAFNPSHLEIVNPVVVGSVYARQQWMSKDEAQNSVVPVIIHGDAAVIGQGVNQEMLNFSQARGYSVGGTIHIVVNNQIGFTTSDLRDVRSTRYCTDIFKMVEAPVFHVNADNPEAVAFVTQLAVDYRQTFNKDVVVDLISYRRLGHNEQDEPMVTQPLMYKLIKKQKTAREIYAQALIKQGIISKDDADNLIDKFRNELDKGEHLYNPVLSGYKRHYAVDWSKYTTKTYIENCDTKIKITDLQQLSARMLELPEGFTLHPRVEKIMDNRAQMAQGKLAVDWGMAENLAYASLLAAGYPVRISGEDVGRGTFFHRHAVLHDQNRQQWNEGVYIPLTNISDHQQRFEIWDSVLSEEAVLAFEYGYATTMPDTLTVWEAQFGDFANGAQVVIDQFIASGETKWNRLANLTLLLPHGMEGQGPEHSSARLERFMQLCARRNIEVCQPTTPAQIFHLLRRQMLRPQRKPLIVLTPKSLLRHKEAVNPLSELADGSFQTIIDDHLVTDVDKVERLLLCSGKLYYELNQERKAQMREDIAIVRIEQLYPFPIQAYKKILSRYKNVKQLIWCQEEPRNQGAWYWFLSRNHLTRMVDINIKLQLVARAASSSPAVGTVSGHTAQQRKLLMDAFGTLIGPKKIG